MRTIEFFEMQQILAEQKDITIDRVMEDEFWQTTMNVGLDGSVFGDGRMKIVNIETRNGISIHGFRVRINEPYRLVMPLREPHLVFGVSFGGNIKSRINETECPDFNGYSYIQKVPSDANGYIEHYPSDQEIKVFTVTLAVEDFPNIVGSDFSELPDDFLEALNKSDSIYSKSFISKTDFEERVDSFLNGDFTGKSQQFFVESIMMDLLANHWNYLNGNKDIENKSKINTQDAELADQCKEILLKHFDNPPSLISLARDMAISEAKLNGLFRKKFDKTPYQMIKQHRLKVAHSMLVKEGLSVKEVCSQIGYDSVSSFSNAFLDKYNYRPKDAKTAGLVSA